MHRLVLFAAAVFVNNRVAGVEVFGVEAFLD